MRIECLRLVVNNCLMAFVLDFLLSLTCYMDPLITEYVQPSVTSLLPTALLNPANLTPFFQNLIRQ